MAWLRGIAVVIGLVAIWQAVVSLTGVPEFMLPPPLDVARALADDASRLASHAGVTLAEILLGLDVTLLMVTHDLPLALQLCERSALISEGRIVADGGTRTLLADLPLLARHRLELPYRFQLAAAEAPG